MNPNEKEIREAVEKVNNIRSQLGNLITGTRVVEYEKAIDTVSMVVQSWLQAASELPERKDSCIAHKVFREDCQECMENYTFNSCLDQSTIVVAKKNEEVALLKARVEELEKEVAILKKENAELKQELEACRDANVQKKKRIAELEKLVEERSVNTRWAKAVGIEQEKLVLINKIAELEDALKRVEEK